MAVFVIALLLSLLGALGLRASVKSLRTSRALLLPIWETIYAALSMPNSLVIGVPVLVSAYGPQTEFQQVRCHGIGLLYTIDSLCSIRQCTGFSAFNRSPICMISDVWFGVTRRSLARPWKQKMWRNSGNVISRI
jgi:hypothetical protein